MDFGKIDRVKSSTCAIRARTSILSHNDIIHGVSGGMAQQNKEVTDLGLENQEDAEQRINPARDSMNISFPFRCSALIFQAGSSLLCDQVRFSR